MEILPLTIEIEEQDNTSPAKSKLGMDSPQKAPYEKPSIDIFGLPKEGCFRAITTSGH